MKIIYISILLLLSLATHAETITNTMPCDNTELFVKILTENYKEVPIIIGKADDAANSMMTLWTNPKTGSWTIIATKDNISCVIGVGKSLKLIDLGKPI